MNKSSFSGDYVPVANINGAGLFALLPITRNLDDKIFIHH